MNIVPFSNITMDEKILWALVYIKNGELDNAGNVLYQLNLQTLSQVISIPSQSHQEQSNLFSVKRRVIDAQYLTITSTTFWNYKKSYKMIYPMPVPLEQSDSIYLLWRGEDAYFDGKKKVPYANFAWISGHLSFIDKESVNEYINLKTGDKIF